VTRRGIERSRYRGASGQMRLRIIGKGGVNTAVFVEFLIEFLNHSIKNAGREIFFDRR
jgi:hypothetical protein